MPGKYLLDTNALIYAMNHQLTLPSAIYAISVITELELRCWPGLTESDEITLSAVIAMFTVVGLDAPVKESTIKIRRTTSLKLPDSIIAATAIVGSYTLVTDDEKLRNRHPGKAISFAEFIA